MSLSLYNTHIKNKAFGSESVYEKKFWLSVTGECNNNCLFCLDACRKDRKHVSFNELLRHIQKAWAGGFTKLVLSGGEPTIHPRIADIVRHARSIGFERIQLISNGRMFASPGFAESVIAAGISEVTISIHGHDDKSHDYLTRAPGSFRHIVAGIKNIRKIGENLLGNANAIILNTDICITKRNYSELPHIARMIVEGLGITELNLMSIVPLGNAWKNRREIFYDLHDASHYVHQTIEYCKSRNAVLWLSRFPPEYLEGYEEYIEDPIKMVDDVRGCADDIFVGRETSQPKCHGERCRYCGIRLLCPGLIYACVPAKQALVGVNKAGDSQYETILIGRSNYKHLALLAKGKRVILEFTKPGKKILEYAQSAVRISVALPYIERARKITAKLIVRGAPACLIPGSLPMAETNALAIGHDTGYAKHNWEYYVRRAEELAPQVKMKSLRCRECMHSESCEGVYVNYARIFGMSELLPVKKKLWQDIYRPVCLSVKKGIKEAARLEPVSRSDMPSVIKCIETLGLEHKCLDITGCRTVLVSKSVEALNMLHKHCINEASFSRHGTVCRKSTERIGKMLGYPLCCVRRFTRQDEYNNDASQNIMIKARTLGRLDYRLNNLISPYSLIDFFPCSYNCRKAIKYAEDRLSIIQECGADKGEIIKALKSVVLYSDFSNYVVFDGAVKHEGKQDYVSYLSYHMSYEYSLEFMKPETGMLQELSRWLCMGDRFQLSRIHGVASITIFKGKKIIKALSYGKRREWQIFDFSG